MASVIAAGTTSGTSLNLSGDTSGVLQLASNGSTTAVTIDTAQQIGVGTTSPSNFGNSNNRGITINGQGTAGFVEMQSSGTAYGAVYANSSNAGIRSITALPLTFETNSTERMRISATGNVGIGNSSPSYPLSVASSTADLTVYVQNTKGDASGDIVQVAVTRNTTDGTIRPYTYYNTGGGAYRFYVLDSGNCQNTNGSYGAFSDVKLKENIVDATPKLEDLCKVKVRNYNLKADQTHKQIGVIAQELEEVFAGLVEEIDDRDGDGKDLGTTTKTVKYSVFIPMLIKAIQELNAKVEAQAVRIAELEGAK